MFWNIEAGTRDEFFKMGLCSFHSAWPYWMYKALFPHVPCIGERWPGQVMA
jgi:hypothetical protein